jgi:asparagine synthetase B (glutamine-hydrolysing)
MDLSIAYALYFAARGQGMCYKSGDSTSEPVPYTSPARVLLSGLGADELFGGYGRHYVGYQRAGYAGLIGELKLDVSRLGKRNLGRDDRVMAHWSKEVRFPYLDEQLVLWAIKTSVWDKCDFRNDEDMSGVEPGKRVLRLVALELGLEQVAREKKRAVRTTFHV